MNAEGRRRHYPLSPILLTQNTPQTNANATGSVNVDKSPSNVVQHCSQNESCRSPLNDALASSKKPSRGRQCSSADTGSDERARVKSSRRDGKGYAHDRSFEHQCTSNDEMMARWAPSIELVQGPTKACAKANQT